MTPPKVLLAGYSGREPSWLLAASERFDARIVDIRYSPRSRRPCWDGAALRSYLSTFEDGSERYVWCQAFGNLLYKSVADVRLADPEAGIRFIARETRIPILLCQCRTTRCHRTVAGRLLHERLGVEVMELDEAMRETAVSQLALFGGNEA